jgi:hypothetical protein
MLHVTRIVSPPPRFSLFLFARTRRGLWPTGYRTCQFRVTPSIYITIRYNTYKQPSKKYSATTVESAIVKKLTSIY